MASDDNITSLGTRRFYAADKPKDTKLEDVLDAARDWMKENPGGHIIVCIGRTHEDGGAGTRYFQGGEFTYHGQQGLLHAVQDMLRESG